ncbi:zf-HC2 domain-containing protein [Tumebacillus sp. DT12]|uniref:Anti-sigma-W factor RsiW n=1 Tax=Tumebacillus lacus TaxID=2995335 RepID=A0ABT3X4D6_9BACL|nr:zf-HC2 domain-containing protein [Tumebacillus lacus]MCX7571771.1 zf-HC2 domain-containing protein [Tumebacillus lacus]
MTHEAYRELIQRAIDEDLSQAEQTVLDTHIETCAECRREYDEYMSLAAGLAKLSKVRPETSFAMQMTPELLRQTVEGAAPAAPKRRVVPLWKRAVPAAAAVVLGVGLSIPMTNGWFDHQEGTGQPDHVALLPEKGQEPTHGPTGQLLPEPPEIKPPPDQESTAALTVELKSTQSEPRLIIREKVETELPMRAVAVAPSDLDQVKEQTGVTVTPEDLAKGKEDAPRPPAEKNGDTSGIASVDEEPLPNDNDHVVVVTVNSTPINVTIEGGRVIVTLAPLSGTQGGTEVAVFELNAPHTSNDTTTVTFTDPEGNVIDESSVPVEQPTAVPRVGDAPSLDILDEAMQSKSQSDPARYSYVTDPVRVVSRHLRELGFAWNAQVSGTQVRDRVAVEQGGVRYVVGLTQPYLQGDGGLWKPAFIARALPVEQPGPQERPVLDYFRGQQEAGVIHSFSELLVLSERVRLGTLVVEAHVEMSGPHGSYESSRSQYRFHLSGDNDGTWKLDGSPDKL